MTTDHRLTTNNQRPTTTDQRLMKKTLLVLCSLFFLLAPLSAHAAWGIVDALNLSPFVPLVLDAIMSVAMAGYDFFVGNGTGIIYIMVWASMGFFIAMYLIKMWLPKTWLEFFGFSGGGQMYENNVMGGIQLGEALLKPALRAIVAAALLLPIKPQYVTDFVVDPFLRFGALYTESITANIFQDSPWGGGAPKAECPADIAAKGYLSPESCKFLVQPISDITHANNQIIKRGLQFFDRGLRGLITLVPHGGEDFMNLVTGTLLIITFVSSNFFMALLIIQGIFNFGFQLILYPFNVLYFVVRGKDDKWLDLWDPFKGLIDSLKQLVITMIASAFILVINLAAIKSLFRWNTSVFVPAAGGSAHDNLPSAIAGGYGFGEHSVVWLSAILTFFLMFQIFKKTREKLEQYSGKGGDNLYKQVSGDFKSLRGNVNTGARKALDLWKKYKK